MNARKALLTLLVTSLLATLSQSTVAGGYYHYRHHGGHHGHSDGTALVAGLIIGGLFGYMISEDRHRDRSYYSYRDYPRSRVVYERVEPAPARVVRRSDSEFAGHNCLMKREYTTTVTIDGVEKRAYGTRCMIADGSWVLGRAKFMPEDQ